MSDTTAKIALELSRSDFLEKKVANIAGAILAGGKNQRIGGHNKAFVQINGISIIQRTINILKEIFAEVILVTNSPQDYKSYQREAIIITDLIKDVGPLGGIFSALSQTTKKGAFFVACDMPFLHNGIILRQIDCFNELDFDVLMPRIGNFIEPLHAIYRKGLKENIYRFLKDGNNYSIKSFLQRANVRFWDLEDNLFHRKIFKNLNTYQDVEETKGVLCK